MRIDALDIVSERPVAWVNVGPDRAFSPGKNCPTGHRRTLPWSGVVVTQTPSEEWACVECGEATPNDEILHPDDEGVVRVKAVFNGIIDKNPFLSPPQTRYGDGLGARSDTPDDFWVDVGYTDLANAKRLVAAHGDHFRYVPDFNSFMVYDGYRWRPDNVAALERFAKATVEAMIRSVDVLSMVDEARGKFLSHANASCSKGRIEAMIHLARSERGITMMPEQFDRAKHLLNTQNCVVDLPSGDTMEPSPDDYMTRMAPVNYDQDAECPTWFAFMETLCHGDDELLDWFQKAVGYTLTGETSEQKFFFLHGDGSNGKTTFIEVLRAILGDYASGLSFDVFLKNTRTNPESGLARLRGVRMATAVEAPEGQTWNETLLKTATGQDRITARLLYQNPFEFDPTAKIWFAANHLPAVHGVDTGIWRRFIPIPCRSHIPKEDRDGGLPDRLLAEAAGILAWAVRGAKRWYQEGLEPLPACIQDDLEQYKSDSDVLSRFVSERCVLRHDAHEGAGNLLEAYNEWAKGNRERSMNSTSFGRRLKQFRGGLLKHEKGSDGRIYYNGIQLRSERRGDLDDYQEPTVIAVMSQDERLRFITDTIQRLSADGERGWAKEEDILDITTARGLDPETVTKDLQTLRRNSSIYSKGGPGTHALVN